MWVRFPQGVPKILVRKNEDFTFSLLTLHFSFGVSLRSFLKIDSLNFMVECGIIILAKKY